MQPLQGRGINWLKSRGWAAILGAGLIAAGQWKINILTPPDAPPLALGIWLNNQLHLGDPNIDQVLLSLPLLIAGGLLLALALRGLPLLPPDRAAFAKTPALFRAVTSLWPWLAAGTGAFALLLIRVGEPDFRDFEAPLWILILLLFLIPAALWDLRRNIDLSLHISRQDVLWILGLSIVGILIGAYRLQGFPDQLIGDEGNFWSTARDIAENSFRPSIFSPGVYTFPVFSSYIQAWFLKIFGADLWGWRFSSVLTGIAALPPLYLLAREMFERRIAILSSAMLVISPYFIDFSRLGYNNIQALFFTTIALYWLYAGLQRRSALHLYLAGILTGLGFYTFFAARMTIVIAVGFILCLWLVKQIRFRDAGFALLILSVGFILVIVPYFVYSHRYDPQGLSYKTLESVFINTFNGLQFYTSQELYAVAPPVEFNGNELFFNPKIYAVLVLRGFLRTMLVFQKSGLISEHYIAFPLTGTIGAFFYLIGLSVSAWTWKQARNLLVIIWFLVNVFALSALNTVPPRHTHMVAIIPALALLTAVGLSAIFNAASAMTTRIKSHAKIYLTLLVALTALGGLYDFFVRAPGEYKPHPDQIITWAELESHGESFFFVYDDPAQIDIFKPYPEITDRPLSFTDVPIENVMAGKIPFPAKPTIVFSPPELADDISAALQKQWGNDFIRRMFYSTDGTPVLSARMNTNFLFEEDKTFLRVLQDSYTRPALLWLVAVLLAVFALIVFSPNLPRFNLPALLSKYLRRLTAPIQASENQASSSADIAQAPKENLPIEPPAISDEENETDFIPIRPPRFLHRFFPNNERAQDGVTIFAAQTPNSLLLIAGIALAIVGQILVSSAAFFPGISAYIISAVCLLAWAWETPKWRNAFSKQVSFTPKFEAAIFGLILLVTIGVRFFDLQQRVYGLEADETKWTVQSWYSAILHVDVGEFASMHYKYLPVDFWVRSLFLRVFGLDFISARIESAVLSVLSVIFLYLLVRLLTSSASTALLSALLFSLSFMELNAAHQALHNTPPAAWMLAALFCLFLAFHKRKLWQFQLAGILLGLGMLTYETFYPNSVAALVYLIGLGIYEIVKKKDSPKNWLARLVVLAWPVVFVYFAFSRDYLAGRQGYLMGALQDITASGHGFGALLNYFLLNAKDALQTTFAHVVWADSLINWNGPLINPMILPFVVIGLIYNLWNLRRPHFLFIPLWYLALTISGPILLGSSWPRVMYLALPPLMIWGALGLWMAFAALRALFNAKQLWRPAGIFGLAILVILLNDHYIFTSKLLDPIDRQKRRELADLVYASAQTTPMLLFPYLPSQNDSLEVESQVLIFSVAGARHLGLDAADHYRQIQMDDVLTALWEMKHLNSLDLFYDKSAETFPEERARKMQIILNCYPKAILQSQGRFFDVYHFDSAALTSPSCYSPPPPSITEPPEDSVWPQGSPPTLKWNVNGVTAGSFTVQLERKMDDVHWIEAEDFKGDGWSESSSFVHGFSGMGFLMDEWQAGQASDSIDLPASGQYRVWIRYYKRRDNDQRNFLEVNGRSVEFAENGGVLNEWAWKDAGVFDLPAGTIPLALTRAYGTDDEYSIFVDSIVITSNLNFQPVTEDSEWQAIQNSGEINSTVTEYTLPSTLPPGEYRWEVRIFDAGRLVDYNGERGIKSRQGYFTVR